MSGDEVPDNSNDNRERFNSPNPQRRAGTIPVSAIDSERPRPRNQQRMNFDDDDQSRSSDNHEISEVFDEEIERRVTARLQQERARPPLAPAITLNATSKYIDKRSYKDTPPQTYTEIFALRLSQFGIQKQRKLRSMHNILASIGLLTMLLEQRKKPVVTETNTFGFALPHMYNPVSTPAIDDDIDNESVSTFALSTNGEDVPIDEDDIGLFTYDKARLMRIVEYMFDKDIQSHGEKYKIANDPIGYYKAIMKIVFSERPRERTEATNAFMQYKISRNSTIAEEQVRWTEVVTTYNDLHKRAPITPDAMLAFLQ